MSRFFRNRLEIELEVPKFLGSLENLDDGAIDTEEEKPCSGTGESSFWSVADEEVGPVLGV